VNDADRVLRFLRMACAALSQTLHQISLAPEPEMRIVCTKCEWRKVFRGATPECDQGGVCEGRIEEVPRA
jgi:hypothetical protein